jgi:Mlc titration factor MtfA (ptsG expression regulator)
MRNFRFAPWIALFFILLGSIPVILSYKGVTLAKTIGIMVVIAIITALWVWRINTRKKSDRNQRVVLTANDIYWLKEHIPFYNGLNKDDKRTFEDRIGIFMADITITEIGEEVADQSTRLYVASSAVIAFWGLPYWNYGDLHEVLVYPSNFDVDNRLNKIGQFEGKVYHGGLMDNTMILSLPSLKSGFQIENDKKNVGVHEFAHLLDKSDGSIDGIPEFMGDEDRALWTELMDEEIRKIKEKDSTIPAYGATNHGEFFAVIMEYYRECPSLLKIKHRPLFDVLEKHLADPKKN